MFGFKRGRKEKQPAAEPAGEYLTARLNARVQPIDRGEYYEDPLDETMTALGIGAVTGGGTQLADEPAGIEFCDLEIRVNEASSETLAAIVKRLEDLGAPKGSKLIPDGDGREIAFGQYEGIGVFLNGTDLPDAVYKECDVNHVIERFNQLLAENGAFRGYWQGSRETALYCYGPSFTTMKAALEPFLASYPLCERARIEQIA